MEHKCFDCGEDCDCGGNGGDDCVGCEPCKNKAAEADKRIAALSGKS
jgi:hypothetical protein